MPTIDELERASYFFANMTDHDLEMRGFAPDRKHCEIALELIRSALDRERNEPKTCEGCVREACMHAHIDTHKCYYCLRARQYQDNYETKGEADED